MEMFLMASIAGTQVYISDMARLLGSDRRLSFVHQYYRLDIRC